MTEQWIGLELRHLSALQAIDEEGSFKDAAIRLGYTPSAISQQIASLERIVGTRVIEREHGRSAVGLTDAGKVLLCHMAAIEARLTAARTDLEAITKGVAGTLRVGVWESVGTRLLPELICRFRGELPEVRLDIVDAADDHLIVRSLERGLIDVAFVVQPLPPGPFEARTVLTDPWVLVARVGSEHAALARPSTLVRGTLPLLCYRSARAIEPAIRHLRREGVELEVVLRSDYNTVLQELAAAGLGVALLPRLAVDEQDERVVVTEIEALVPPRRIDIAWHRDRAASEALQAFVALAVEVGASLDDTSCVGLDLSYSAA